MALNLVYESSYSAIDYSYGWASLYGPAFYLYIRTLTLRPLSLWPGILHFLFFILINLFNLFGFQPEWLPPIIGAQLFGYITLSAYAVYKAYNSLPHQHSEPVNVTLSYTRVMVIIFALLLLYDVWAHSQVSSPVLLGLAQHEITLIGVFVMIHIMFLRQLTIPLLPALKEQQISAEGEEKTVESVKTHDKARIQALITHVRANELQKIPNLTLSRLAESFGESERTCSEMLNQGLNVNFADFINKMRVEDCKSALINEKSRSVLDIAIDAGFNSKTSFNNAFKKFTNKTPTEFRKSERSDLR